MRALNTAGDTIVEVLIAIAVISLVLVAAYTSATRSFNNSRQTQERAEALKVVESQLEVIKAYAKDATLNVYNPTVYCIDTSTAPPTQRKFVSPTYDPFTKAKETDDFTKYPSGCTQSFYHVAIKYTQNTPGPPPSSDDFIILVRWNRIGGQNDELKLQYRLHK